MKVALAARLMAAASGLVGTRVDWERRKQGSALPCYVLHHISGDRPQHMDDFIGLNVARVQVNSLGATAAIVQTLHETAITALVPEATQSGVKFSRSFVENERDISVQTETEYVHGSSFDLIIHYSS